MAGLGRELIDGSVEFFAGGEMIVAVKEDIDAVPDEKLVDGSGRPGAASNPPDSPQRGFDAVARRRSGDG